MKTERRKIECLCPMCGRVFKAKMFYTGRGKPRVYCTACLPLVNKVDDDFGVSCGSLVRPRKACL